MKDTESTNRYNIGEWIDSESALHHKTILFFQALFAPYFKYLAKKHVSHVDQSNLPEVPPKNSGFIIYGNHQHKYDPLMITWLLPDSWKNQMKPFRFITHNIHFFNSYLSRKFLALFGAYPARKNDHNKPYGIEHSKYVVNRKQCLVIFPEGKRTKTRSKAYDGIEAIAEGQNVIMLPVKVSWNEDTSADKVTIKYGEPFAHKKQSAEELMHIVYNL